MPTFSSNSYSYYPHSFLPSILLVASLSLSCHSLYAQIPSTKLYGANLPIECARQGHVSLLKFAIDELKVPYTDEELLEATIEGSANQRIDMVDFLFPHGIIRGREDSIAFTYYMKLVGFVIANTPPSGYEGILQSRFWKHFQALPGYDCQCMRIAGEVFDELIGGGRFEFIKYSVEAELNKAGIGADMVSYSTILNPPYLRPSDPNVPPKPPKKVPRWISMVAEFLKSSRGNTLGCGKVDKILTHTRSFNPNITDDDIFFWFFDSLSLSAGKTEILKWMINYLKHNPFMARDPRFVRVRKQHVPSPFLPQFTQ